MATINISDTRKITWSALSLFRGCVNNYRVVLYLIHAYKIGLLDYFSPEDNVENFIGRLMAERGQSFPGYELKLFQVFQPELSQLNRHGEVVHDFISLLSRFEEEWFVEHESELFDECISAIAETESKAIGLYSQPEALSKFVAAISGYDGKGSLYNPFAGTATYCTEMAGTGRYVAQELDPTVWAIGSLRLLAHGMNPSTYYCEDSIRQWRGLSGFDDVAEHFDCIVATPPFSMRVRDYNLPWAYGNFTLGEDIYIWNCLASVAVSGIAIGVFSHNVIARGGKSFELLQRYVDSDILDSVILLPSGVFPSTNIPIIILKFNRNKEKPGQVRIVDGSSFVRKEKVRSTILYAELLEAIQSKDERFVTFVSIDKIREQDYNLKPAHYFKEEIQVPEGFEKIKLEEILEPVSGSRPRNPEGKGRVVSGGSLSNSPFDYLLEISSLPEEDLNGNYRKISTPVLLLSRIRTLKPTFAQASESEPIYINPNVLAYRTREGVNVFIPELIRVLSQIDDIQTGASLPSISAATIRNIEVVLPKDIAMQEELYNNSKREFKLAKVRELGLEELMASQKMEFVSIIQRRQHDLNNMLRRVRQACNVISASVRENGHDSDLIDEDSDMTLSQAFNSVQQYFDSMSQVINHLADEENYAEPEIIDLIPRLKALAEQKHRNFSIRYSEDGYALCDVVQDDDVYHAYVKFGSPNLDRVFFNIIQNAEKHGFTDPSRTDYLIDIEISHDYESSCFVIRFKNNGKRMPEGMDTRRYGRREPAGVTGGNGDGGAIVKSTVEHYGGSIAVINEPDAWFPVCIELKIPHYDE